MFKGQFVVFVGIFEVSRLMMLFGSFREIRIVPSRPPTRHKLCKNYARKNIDPSPDRTSLTGVHFQLQLYENN